MKDKEIRSKLSAAHAVNGVNALVRRIGAGPLRGGWSYKKFRPGMYFVRQPWLYAGTTSEVVRFLS